MIMASSLRTDDTMRQQIDRIFKIIVGNGDVGLCEQMRNTRADITELTETVLTLAGTVQTVSERQDAHDRWHAAPEHMTIQESLSRPGVRWIVGLVIAALVLAGVMAGVVDGVALVKSLL